MYIVCAHRTPINRIQTQAGVRVAVRLRAADGDVVVDKDVLSALGVGENGLATGSVYVPVRRQDERATSVAEIPTRCIQEGAVRRRGPSNEYFVLISGRREGRSVESAAEA